MGCTLITQQVTIPGNVSRDRCVEIVAKYLKNHPERWNELAAFLVRDALKEAFSKEDKE